MAQDVCEEAARYELHSFSQIKLYVFDYGNIPHRLKDFE